MAPQEAQAGALKTQLKELQAAADAAQTAALESHVAGAEERRRTAKLGAQVVLVTAYSRRLQRLATLLQQYDEHLHQALAGLGLATASARGEQEQGGVAVGDWAQGLGRVAAELAKEALSAAAGPGAAPGPAAEALLLLGSRCTPLAAHLAAAGVGTALEMLQGSIDADLDAVNSWPAAAPLPGAGTSGPLSDAFSRLQQEQKARWEVAAQRQLQLERLRYEVAAVRQALTDSGFDTAPAMAAAARTRLAARQAGLRAELGCLERASRQAEEAAGAAVQRGQQVKGLHHSLVEAEQQEAALDAAVRAMCVANDQVMRQWRQGSWHAAEHVEAHVLSQRQPLLHLSEQLLAVQRRELAAFRKESSASAVGAGKVWVPAATAAAAADGVATGSGDSSSATAVAGAVAVAQLLDPLAGCKSGAHAAMLLEVAASELQQLRPVHKRWAALAAYSGAQLAELLEAAAELQRQVQLLQKDGGSAALSQLQEAAAAAEEGVELVGRVRQALSEWWTTPAVAATPWLKRGGKSADEWLRVLGDQQRALRQREAFTGRDQSNTRRQGQASG